MPSLTAIVSSTFGSDFSALQAASSLSSTLCSALGTDLIRSLRSATFFFACSWPSPGPRANRARPFLPAGDDAEVVHRLRAFEDPGQVIIDGREWIELADRGVGAQPIVNHKRPASIVSSCSSMMSISILTGSSSASILGPMHRKPVAISRSAAVSASGRRQQISGELLADKLVVRFVAEGLDDAPAITPGIAEYEVFVHPVGVGIANHVEPVPGPAFAIARRGQQTDRLSSRQRLAVSRLRRSIPSQTPRPLPCMPASQPDRNEAVESGVAARVRRRGCRQAILLQLRKNESVDWRTHPGIVFDGRQLLLANGLERPVIACSLVKTGSLFLSSTLTTIAFSSGQTAPIFTQAVKSAISLAGSFIRGGICRSSPCRIA